MKSSVSGRKRSASPVRWIVGIGASAGGLEAFSELLQALDTATGMTFVLVQHLAPNQKSLLAGLLAAKTTLPVLQAEDGMALLANHVFVIPPDTQLTIADGRIHLDARPKGREQHLPINTFFHSLAQWSDGHCIGIVLSGSADDGALGLREIKAVGGITIAQEPATARYQGMPRAAIATDAVDLVLSPAAIAVELARIAALPIVGIDGADVRRAREQTVPVDDGLRTVFQLLREHGGVDFSQYKSSTILRRMQRRMVLKKAATVASYVAILRGDAKEAADLFQDLLIHVTSFFRDPASFAALRADVLPKLLHRRDGDAPLRIWVPGCATGEEAYSLAICLLEAMEGARLAIPVQIFATDVSEAAIATARAATYPEAIAADVSAARLARYFTRTDTSYRVAKVVRDCCIFARHDLTRDPPFSKLELILCRNLLIYLEAPLQRRLMGVLHYALRPGGFLMLGSSETIGTQTELFSIVDKSHRIYVRKQPDGAPPAVAQPSATARPRDERLGVTAGRVRVVTTLSQEASQILLARYAPAGVIVDDDLRVVHFRGQTGPYLEPAPGEATLHLLNMMRGGLLSGTRSALIEAKKSGLAAHRTALPVDGDGTTRSVDVVVLPLPSTVPERHFLVLFEEKERHAAPRGDGPPSGRSPPSSRPKRGAGQTSDRESAVVAGLQKELAESRAYLQSVNQDLESANQELQSANEEILSNNEELQSANEELDTAKEEMQSANEELATVNDELRARNDELSRLNADLGNLLASVQIAIVIVDPTLRIRRFTPKAESVLNLIPSDVGRPFTDIKPNVDLPEIGALIEGVIRTGTIVERDVRDREGRNWSLRIRPYQGIDGHVDGAVAALFDIEASVRNQAHVRDSLDLAEAIFATVREPMAVLDADLRIERVNPAFCRAFGIDPATAVGRRVGDLSGANWLRPELHRQLQQVFSVDRPFEHLDLMIDGNDASNGMVLNARRIARDGGKPGLLLLAGNAVVRA
jgi:two-component system CheB/CheR fusion protein